MGVISKKIICFYCASIILLGLSGCGGGGGGGGSSGGGSSSAAPTQALTYSGNTNSANITPDNTRTLSQNVTGSNDVAVATVLGVVVDQQSTKNSGVVNLSTRLNDRLHSTLDQIASNTSSSAQTVVGVSVDTTQPCTISGSISLSGSISDTTGTGTLNITFNSCADNTGWLNGQATYKVDAYNPGYDLDTDATFNFSTLQFKDTGIDVSLSGSMRSEVFIATNKEQITSNFVTNDNLSGKLAKIENLVLIADYASLFNLVNPSSFSLSITSGRIFDSTEGYVDITTTAPWFYATLTQDYPSSGGALVLTGASNVHIAVTPLSTTLVKVELDLDANGIYELSSTMPWTFLETSKTSNSAPTANAGANQKLSQSQPAVITLNGSGSSDPDYDFLTYQWVLVQKPNGSQAQLSGAATVQPNFTPDVEGIYVINLVVSDGKLISGSSTVTVTFSNTAPIANAGPNQTVSKFSMVTLNGSGSSDPDNDFLTYQWTQTQKPSGSQAQLSGVTSAHPTFIPDIAGDYVASLTVSDGKLNNTSIVTISAYNIAPVANAGQAQYIFSGNQISLDGTKSMDGNGDPLTYAWSFILKPQGSAATLSSTTTVNPVFTPDSTGVYRVSLTVNDGTVSSTASIITIYVVTPPAISAKWNVPGNFPTIQAAINAASPGDTIVVAPGKYVENLRFNGKSVTLQSTAGATKTIIEGSNDTAIDIGPGGGVIGFTIQKGAAYFGAGMAVQGAGTLIKQNIFESNTQYFGGYGAAIGGNVASPIIDSNIFRNNSCENDNQWSTGVISFVNDSSPVIKNNLIQNNPCRAINISYFSTTPQIINNTIISNRTGIYFERTGYVPQHIYRNNIVVGNIVGIESTFGSEANNPVWENNLVFGNGTNYSGTTDKTGTSGNISIDPMFVDQAGGYYFLKSGSPAIDHGTNTGAPVTDFTGRTRPLDGNTDGTAVTDIGAFEY